MLLSRPYQISYKMVDRVENIILRLTLDNGIVGWGASNISSYVVGQTNDDTLRICKDGSLDFLQGGDIRLFNHWIREVDRRFKAHTGVRVMLDVALHDAFTQYLGVPLSSFLGVHHRSLPTSVTIGIMGIEETIKEAQGFLTDGFHVIKVKLGAQLEEDINRLVALRNTFGDKIVIRIDANQGWTKAETLRFFESTQHLDIELIEQPIKASDLIQLGDLPIVHRKKIAADESLVDASDALHLTQDPIPAGIFNIKLMKCGGITEALRIADIAATKDIELMWGCNDESIISITAALHTAFACPHTKYLDLDGSLDLAKDVVKGGFEIKSGYMYLLDRPGLGVEPLD